MVHGASAEMSHLHLYCTNNKKGGGGGCGAQGGGGGLATQVIEKEIKK